MESLTRSIFTAGIICIGKMKWYNSSIMRIDEFRNKFRDVKAMGFVQSVRR
ncbi:MAG: hypothetical protein FWG02_07675 [Holophagaceae bacterium]|nr:hypothetical protein [Holophagaceae bacterium]